MMGYLSGKYKNHSIQIGRMLKRISGVFDE
jgi:hypothetical protein